MPEKRPKKACLAPPNLSRQADPPVNHVVLLPWLALHLELELHGIRPSSLALDQWQLKVLGLNGGIVNTEIKWDTNDECCKKDLNSQF